MTPEAEKFNGWAAMLGFVAAFGAYIISLNKIQKKNFIIVVEKIYY